MWSQTPLILGSSKLVVFGIRAPTARKALKLRSKSFRSGTSPFWIAACQHFQKWMQALSSVQVISNSPHTFWQIFGKCLKEGKGKETVLMQNLGLKEIIFTCVSLLFYCPLLAPWGQMWSAPGKTWGAPAKHDWQCSLPSLPEPSAAGAAWLPVCSWLETSESVAEHPPSLPLGRVCWASGRALCACRRQETRWDSQKWESRDSPNTRFPLDTTYTY